MEDLELMKIPLEYPQNPGASVSSFNANLENWNKTPRVVMKTASNGYSLTHILVKQEWS